MTILSYKGYQGSVTYDDGSLLIQILHIDDFISTNCLSAEDAKAEFEALVDDYLETCTELGREPQKAFSGTFNVRMAQDLHRQAAMAASSAQQSLNAWVVNAVEERLRREMASEMGSLNTLMQRELLAFSQRSRWFAFQSLAARQADPKTMSLNEDFDPKSFIKYVGENADTIKKRNIN